MSGGLCVLLSIVFILFEISYIVRDRTFFFMCLGFLLALLWGSVFIMYKSKCDKVEAFPYVWDVLALRPCKCVREDGTRIQVP